MSMIDITSTQLRQAADLKDQIANLNQQLAALFVGSATASAVQSAKPATRKKRGMSAAGKARIVAAQKLRWAKVHAARAKPSVVAKPAKKKFTMSAAGKARIVAAQKLRWAKVNAGKAKPAPVAKPAAKAVVVKAVVAAKPATKKGKISPEGMARIIAATKARWAKIRAAKVAKKK